MARQPIILFALWILLKLFPLDLSERPFKDRLAVRLSKKAGVLEKRLRNLQHLKRNPDTRSREYRQEEESGNFTPGLEVVDSRSVRGLRDSSHS